MATFTPPTDNYVHPVIITDIMGGFRLNKDQRQANNWGRHLAGGPRGRNVYLLTNGTVTENQPSDENLIVRTYLGGHNNEVDATEVATLTAAGYGAYIT